MRTTQPQTTKELGHSHARQQRQLIDVPTLAEKLGVTQRFIRRLTAEDRVPFLKIGKFVRFDPLEIDRWIDTRRNNHTD